MKILFTCNMCRESFKISDKYLVDKISVACPNCSSEFPKQNLELLSQGVSSILESRSKMELQNTEAGYTHLFEFTIED